jgi:putative hydrolase of the HAD superfamily
MRLPVTTLLFDMDNTLFDLVDAQIAACHAVAEHLGQADGTTLFDHYFMSDLRGFESHENIRDYLRDRSIPENGNFHTACRIYETVKLDRITPYAGVLPTLEKFRRDGFHMAIITDAHSRDATRRLERSGLLPFFDGMVAFDMVGVKKPAREPFLCALEMLRAGPGETLLVGDSPRRDIRPARDLGICTVYARYGDRFSDIRECPDADFIINAMDELIPIIDSFSPAPE